MAKLSNLEYALSYLARGWNIIPVGEDKRPLVASWTEFQTKRPSMAQVMGWWREHPQAGIAVICGQVSGLIVVDIDSGKGEPDLEGLFLPPTLCSRTGCLLYTSDAADDL